MVRFATAPCEVSFQTLDDPNPVYLLFSIENIKINTLLWLQGR